MSELKDEISVYEAMKADLRSQGAQQMGVGA
jgi:hypothetical protein